MGRGRVAAATMARTASLKTAVGEVKASRQLIRPVSMNPTLAMAITAAALPGDVPCSRLPRPAHANLTDFRKVWLICDPWI